MSRPFGARYAAASTEAQPLREARSLADTARTRMLREKERVKADAKRKQDYSRALGEERLAQGLYDRLAFREATEQFGRAEKSFKRSQVLPPAGIPF